MRALEWASEWKNWPHATWLGVHVAKSQQPHAAQLGTFRQRVLLWYKLKTANFKQIFWMKNGLSNFIKQSINDINVSHFLSTQYLLSVFMYTFPCAPRALVHCGFMPEHWGFAWFYLCVCKKHQKLDTIWIYSRQKIIHAIKWKLEESEGMASAKIIINIISNFSLGAIPSYVHGVPIRPGQARISHKGPHTCLGSLDMVHKGLLDKVGRLCYSALWISNKPEGSQSYLQTGSWERTVDWA